MSFLCKIGIHDWEDIESINADQLFENTTAKLVGRRPVTVINNNADYPFKRVCVRCGKKQDTIAPAIAFITAEYYKDKEREETAKKLWEE